MSIQSIISLFDKKTYLQLGWASVNLPDLCLKWGDFNFAGSHAWKPEAPRTWNFEMVACKVEVPPLQAQIWGVHTGLTQLHKL